MDDDNWVSFAFFGGPRPQLRPMPRTCLTLPDPDLVLEIALNPVSLDFLRAVQGIPDGFPYWYRPTPPALPPAPPRLALPCRGSA